MWQEKPVTGAQALCSAIIGTGNSRFDQNPGTYTGPFGFFPYEIETLSGNTKLKPEIARTWTAGVVLRSPFRSAALSKITASIDWYHIEIEGLVAPLDPVTTYQLCFNANGASNPTYSVSDPGGFCKYINRDPVTGDRHLVLAPYANLGGLKTSGLDLVFAFHWFPRKYLRARWMLCCERACHWRQGTQMTVRIFAGVQLSA